MHSGLCFGQSEQGMHMHSGLCFGQSEQGREGRMPLAKRQGRLKPCSRDTLGQAARTPQVKRQ